MGKRNEVYNVGTIHKAKYSDIEIIEDLGKTKKVKFLDDNSEVICHTSQIKRGTLTNFNVHVEKYGLWTIHKNKRGEEFIIIEVLEDRKRKIKFLDENMAIITVGIYNIQKLQVKNPMAPNVLEVAYFGVGKYSYKNNSVIYITWRNMLRRLYEEKELLKRPNYRNVSVCNEWLNFQNFAKWYEGNFPKHIESVKFQLDKDLLQQGVENKVYSPNTCVFLPSRMNSFLASTKSYNKTGYVGAYLNKGIPASKILDFSSGKPVFLGNFSTLEEASQAYKTARAINVEKAKQYLRDLNYLPESIIDCVY